MIMYGSSFGFSIEQREQMTSVEEARMLAALQRYAEDYDAPLHQSVGDDGMVWFQSDTDYHYQVLSHFLSGYLAGLGFDENGRRVKTPQIRGAF
jgi:hypothetical protein